MNPPKYHGSKVDEDPTEFIDEAYRTMAITRGPSEEKTELMTYQLKDMVWYDQWVEERGQRAGHIEWEE